MERFLLDTNIISELIRPKPNENLIGWISEQKEENLYLSVITIAEIIRGISKLDNGKKKERLLNWVGKDVSQRFSGRILDFDEKCAFIWGEWQGEGDRLGTPYAIMDSQIASISFRFELTLVTRNTKDFKKLPIKCVDPWSIDTKKKQTTH
jgi:predicted nucleic acid-binding protein